MTVCLWVENRIAHRGTERRFEARRRSADTHTDRGALQRGGVRVPFGQRAAAVLVAAQGWTVAKADILARAWPDTVVEDGNMTIQVASLRKALGQDREGRDWIVTVPRLGHRLVTAGGAPGWSAKVRIRGPSHGQ